jgi:1,4-dihydroxy-2-naphthoate octaprenyltransferase
VLAGLFPIVVDLRFFVCWALMLIIAVLMQSAANTLNDYQDFRSGLDNEATVLDKSDASIVYNRINPKAALRFGIALLVVAAILGAVVVVLSNLALLVIGVVAAAVVVLYSFGPRPISSLPLGELVSGLVMGGCITVATYIATTKGFIPQVLLLALPPILGIAMIMFTNNTCDIERDTLARRRTLAVLLGRRRAIIAAVVLVLLTLVWMAVLCVIYWLPVLAMVVAAILLSITRLRRIIKGPYDAKNRRKMMQNITGWCLRVNGCWFIGLFIVGVTRIGVSG